MQLCMYSSKFFFSNMEWGLGCVGLVTLENSSSGRGVRYVNLGVNLSVNVSVSEC